MVMMIEASIVTDAPNVKKTVAASVCLIVLFGGLLSSSQTGPEVEHVSLKSLSGTLFCG